VKYPSEPEVGVGALLLSGGRVLLVRRSNQPGRGKWSVPGGHLELGEGIYEAAVRELMEETGIRGRPLGVVGVSELIERDGEGRVLYHYVLVDVLMEPEAGSRPEGARAGSDAMDVAFVDLESALRMDLTDSARGLLERASSGALPLLAVSTWSGRAARSDERPPPSARSASAGEGLGTIPPQIRAERGAHLGEGAAGAMEGRRGRSLPAHRRWAGRAAGGDPSSERHRPGRGIVY
jgi:ADP-ribose pyrophosphatase